MSIELFNYGLTDLRTIKNESDDYWFVAADVAQILEYRDAHNMTRRLDDEDKGTHSVSTVARGEQAMTVISEAGFYAAILGSQSERAKAVKRWLTHEVLPALRKTGTYSTAPALTDDELIHQALSISATRVAALTERVAELEPKAELADAYLTAGGGERLVDQAAKLLGMKAKALRAFMLEQRLMFTRYAACGTTQYEHYADFAEHFGQREHTVNHSSGQCAHYTLTIKPRGIDLIRKRLRDQEDAA